jgi:hypothetical protein
MSKAKIKRKTRREENFCHNLCVWLIVPFLCMTKELSSLRDFFLLLLLLCLFSVSSLKNEEREEMSRSNGTDIMSIKDVCWKGRGQRSKRERKKANAKGQSFFDLL